jgi:hypothetical protein
MVWILTCPSSSPTHALVLSKFVVAQHIYKNHPPKKEGEAVPTDFSDPAMRKTLLKAIRTYHQDKNGMDDHG